MFVHDFIDNKAEFAHLEEFFNWATSPEIESTGQARYQLGYYDALHNCPIASNNQDYLRGYNKCLLLISANQKE